MRALRPLLILASTAALAVAVSSSGSANAGAAKKMQWAPAATATVHPGIQTLTANSQCTANFVFTDGSNVFLGQAAHCAGTEGNTATDGCLAASLPLGTVVKDARGRRLGELAYSSWLTMHAANEKDANACSYNDLALIKLDPEAIAQTNPSVPTFGGPTALRTTGFARLNQVFSYGNSSLRAGVVLLPRRGVIFQELGGGWSHQTYTVTPGIPGDSGSGLLDSNGRASGVLSTIVLSPTPAANNSSDLNRMLNYAAAHGMRVSLVPGDVPFKHAAVGTLF